MPLEIERQIAPTKWMKSSSTVQLLDALQGNILDSEPQALFVGGAVRNTLLLKSVEDVDIATPLLPEDVMQILEHAEIKVIPTGIDHGTVTAIIDRVHYEITTLRHDKKTDGRHAEVSFTKSWEEDAKRRDFTMNTLLMDRNGAVYDPLGLGLDDLDKKRVAFVGDADKRIEEDYLRILRFFRFSAIYSDEYDQEGLKACKKGAGSIQKLSKERITQEFFKIIASDKPYEVLKIMFDHDVLSELHFDDYDPEFFEHFCTFQSRYKLSAFSSRLFVFATLSFANIKKMEALILFPKVFIKDMKLIFGSLGLPDLSNDHSVKVSLYRFGRVASAQALMVELVQDRVMSGYAPKALEIIQNWEIPDFPVTGNDLMKKGMAQGPELGKELDRLEQEWIDNGFKTDQSA